MDLAAACQQVADLDQRLQYGTDYSIDLQVERMETAGADGTGLHGL